ncbi:MAG: sigma-70 family RNA polymerase sigma factor [Planctomycetota bacterium]
MSPESVSRRFEALLAEHGRIVLKVAASYARGEADRADLAQEIAVQLWRAFPRYDAARPFTTWLYRIALNVAISHARRVGARRELPLEEAELDPADTRAQADVDEGQPLLERLLASLTPLERALVVLWLEERPHQEIAEILGLTESNVSTRLHRLKQRLRARFPDPHLA